MLVNQHAWQSGVVGKHDIRPASVIHAQCEIQPTASMARRWVSKQHSATTQGMSNQISTLSRVESEIRLSARGKQTWHRQPKPHRCFGRVSLTPCPNLLFFFGRSQLSSNRSCFDFEMLLHTSVQVSTCQASVPNTCKQSKPCPTLQCTSLSSLSGRTCMSVYLCVCVSACVCECGWMCLCVRVCVRVSVCARLPACLSACLHCSVLHAMAHQRTSNIIELLGCFCKADRLSCMRAPRRWRHGRWR